MSYVLIVMTLVAGGHAHFVFQEFGTEQACIEAKAIVDAMNPPAKGVACTAKGG